MHYKTIIKDLFSAGSFNLPTAEEMSFFDKKTIASGISEINLVRKVAREIFSVVDGIFEYGDQITVIVGSGNNGSDGIILAQLLNATKKYKVKVYFVSQCKHQELREEYLGEVIQEEQLIECLQYSDYVIDSILGSGQSRPLYGEALKICKLLSSLDLRIISIDGSTGICTDSGEVYEYALKPEISIFVQNIKRGFIYVDPIFLGQVYIIDAGIKIEETKSEIISINNLEIPTKKNDQHKKTYSDCFVIGGSLDMPGGHDLAVRSAIRSGASYLKTFRYPFSNLPSEVIALNLSENLNIKNLDTILNSINDNTILAIGSALGISKQTKELVKELIALPNKKVIDADALNIIAEDNLIPKNAILTPHPKEASRLLFVDVDVVQKNRFESAKTISLAYNSVVLLKGHCSIITDAEKFYVNPTGNPELATAGTGDVLTGIIAGTLCSGLSLLDAAKLGCFLHGHSADSLVEKFFPIIASDLIEEIPRSFKYVYTSKFSF